MEAVDIVEALNQFHEKLAGEIGGQFVLQKSLLPMNHLRLIRN